MRINSELEQRESFRIGKFTPKDIIGSEERNESCIRKHLERKRH